MAMLTFYRTSLISVVRSGRQRRPTKGPRLFKKFERMPSRLNKKRKLPRVPTAINADLAVVGVVAAIGLSPRVAMVVRCTLRTGKTRAREELSTLMNSANWPTSQDKPMLVYPEALVLVVLVACLGRAAPVMVAGEVSVLRELTNPMRPREQLPRLQRAQYRMQMHLGE